MAAGGWLPRRPSWQLPAPRWRPGPALPLPACLPCALCPQVGNQREVERWIDVMVFHGGVAPLGPTGKAPGGALRVRLWFAIEVGRWLAGRCCAAPPSMQMWARWWCCCRQRGRRAHNQRQGAQRSRQRHQRTPRRVRGGRAMCSSCVEQRAARWLRCCMPHLGLLCTRLLLLTLC